ncbi:MAG: hypothetical protein E4H23_07140, partial [Chrysiogenales bacterium]
MKKEKLFLIVLAITLIAVSLTAQTVLPEKKVPPLTRLSGAEFKANGELLIRVWKDQRWIEAGRLPFNSYLLRREVDLAPYLEKSGPVLVSICQQGGGAAFVDAVRLGGRKPLPSRSAASPDVLKKLAQADSDLVPAGEQSLELAFAGDAPNTVLEVSGRIEGLILSKEPLQFPYENLWRPISAASRFYTYRLGAAPPPSTGPAQAAHWQAVAGRPPFFQQFAPTGSGHPAGTTYCWLGNDDNNLYVTLDFTSDNTCDGDKDYAKVYVKNGIQVKEFRVSVPETQWGKAYFVYTDKVSYQHKVYDFTIPLAELGVSKADQPLELAFAAYGTTVAYMGSHPRLAFDSKRNRYLMVYADEGTDLDIFGRFVKPDGSYDGPALPICSHAEMQVDPDVAYDALSDRFLVVWTDYRNFTVPFQMTDIYGQLLKGNGVLAGEDFPLSQANYDQTRPAVACNSKHQRFMVVWEDWRNYIIQPNLAADIYGLVVAADGSVYPEGDVNIPVASLPSFQFSPALAYSAKQDRFLVVWQQIGLGIQSQLWRDFPSGEDSAVIGLDTLLDAGSPDVAWDSFNDRFFVVWGIGGFASSRIAGGKIGLGDGDLYGQLLTGRGASFSTSFVVSNASGLQGAPAAAFDRLRRRYLVVWPDSRNYPAPVLIAKKATGPLPPSFLYDAYGQFVAADGFLVGSISTKNFLIRAALSGPGASDVAYNSLCANFLSAWNTGLTGSIGRFVVGPACGILPTVVTSPVNGITATTAAGGGSVTAEGGAPVTERGVCWSPTGLPTTADSVSLDGSGLGEFDSLLSGLLPETLYHVRAYAVNQYGTAYGKELTFTTLDQLTVNFLADPGGGLGGDTVQYVESGGDCTPVLALPDHGYCFSGWTGTNGFSGSDNPLTVTGVTKDMTFTAHFVPFTIQAQRLTEMAWLVRADYGKIICDVSGLAGVPIAKYVLYRRIGSGDFQLLKEIAAAEVLGGNYTYLDQYLEKG